MERTAGLLTGAGAGAAALALLARGEPAGAGVAAAAAVALHALAAPRTRPSVGGALVGGAAGLALGLRLLPGAGSHLVLVAGGALATAGLLLARWSVRVRSAPAAGHLAAVPAALALVVVASAVARDVLRTAGDDPAARTFALAPLLVAAAIGAAAARFLARRHPDLARRLPALLAATALAAWWIEARPLGDVFALADRIQGPSVTRRHFLFGASLLSGALGGFTVTALGGLLAVAAPGAVPRQARVAIGAAWAAAAWFPLPVLAGVVLAGVAGAAASRGRLARLAVAAATVALAALGAHRTTADPWSSRDAAPAGLDEIRTRLVLEGRTPGWPLASSPADPAAGDLPPEAWLCGPAPPDEAAPTVELGARTFDEVRLVARLAVERLAAPVLLLDGRRARFVPAARVADGATARGVVALSAAATAALAAEAAEDPLEALVLRPARTRLHPLRPGLAAANLRRLVRRADRLGRDGASPRPRLELLLAAAILADDARTEDRLFGRLERIDPVRARGLRNERVRAREGLHDFLVAARDADPADADVRHRLGRLYARTGRLLAGLAELTRAVELRPKLNAAAVDLMEAYLDAEEAGVRRWSAGGALLDNPEYAARVHALVRRELHDPDVVARANVALAEALLLLADRDEDDDAAEGRRAEAFQRAGLALLHDPTDPDAHRAVARALVARGLRPTAAHGHASLAARLDPTEPRNHLLALRTAESGAQRRRALAAALANGVR